MPESAGLRPCWASRAFALKRHPLLNQKRIPNRETGRTLFSGRVILHAKFFACRKSGCVSCYYWSSESNNNNNAWEVNLGNGNENNNNKNNNKYVRVVRDLTQALAGNAVKKPPRPFLVYGFNSRRSVWGLRRMPQVKKVFRRSLLIWMWLRKQPYKIIWRALRRNMVPRAFNLLHRNKACRTEVFSFPFQNIHP